MRNIGFGDILVPGTSNDTFLMSRSPLRWLTNYMRHDLAMLSRRRRAQDFNVNPVKVYIFSGSSRGEELKRN